MLFRPGFLLRQVLYDLRVSLLYRPAMITTGLALLAPALTYIEARWQPIGQLLNRTFPWLCGPDVAAAQLVLTTIAGSMMTVLSLTYSVLLMALTLASMQFSPRILFSFLRDSTSQTTLGLFVGTFLYCLLLLRMVHGAPEPFIPQLGMVVALGLALVSLGWLLYFIQHIARGIQANHLIARIAGETQQVIFQVFPEADAAGNSPAQQRLPLPEQAAVILARTSGYVQLIDEESLLQVAAEFRRTLFLHKGPGEFATAGTPLLSVVPGEGVPEALTAACLAAYDLGEIRTMQQDVEYGIRQIVDIALKAISPAVNDPSTAVTCIDHLGVLLVAMAGRREPLQEIRRGEELLLQHRRTTFRRVFDLAFNQIRQYGRTDMAVVLRLLRAFEALALATTNPAHLDAIRHHATLLLDAGRSSFLAGDCAELEDRCDALARLLTSRGVSWEPRRVTPAGG